MKFDIPVQTVKFKDEPTYALVNEWNASTDCAEICAQFDEWQLARFFEHLRYRGVALPFPIANASATADSAKRVNSVVRRDEE
jgi:hypothetical protein